MAGGSARSAAEMVEAEDASNEMTVDSADREDRVDREDWLISSMEGGDFTDLCHGYAVESCSGGKCCSNEPDSGMAAFNF